MEFDRGDESNKENVNEFLNHCFNPKIVHGVIQYIDDKGDIHELITSKGVRFMVIIKDSATTV